MRSLKKLAKSLGLRLYYYCCPDKIYLNRKFREVFGRNINWKNPTTFNEKLQWLKIYDRNPLYTKLVDKYEVRKYIAEKIGEQYLIPCLGVWDRFEDIDFDQLPDQFVLKCTHDSHSVIICKDKSKFDYAEAQKSLTAHLKRNFHYNAREWPYKNVKPRIIAEKYMTEEQKEECAASVPENDALIDYKYFCFDGIPKFMYISNDAGADPRTDFFDMEYKHLPFCMKDPPSDILPPQPKHFEKMEKLAKVLAQGLPHVRVDFYCVGDKIYVGELTFYHCSGFSTISPPKWDRIIGEYLKLPNKKENKCRKIERKVHY